MTQPVHPQVATQRKDTSAKKPTAKTQPSSPSPPPPLLMFFMLPLTIFPSFHKSSFIEVYFTYSEFTHFKRSLMRWSHVIPTVTIKNTCVTPKLPSLPTMDVLCVTGGLSQDFTHMKSHSMREPRACAVHSAPAVHSFSAHHTDGPHSFIYWWIWGFPPGAIMTHTHYT